MFEQGQDAVKAAEKREASQQKLRECLARPKLSARYLTQSEKDRFLTEPSCRNLHETG